MKILGYVEAAIHYSLPAIPVTAEYGQTYLRNP